MTISKGPLLAILMVAIYLSPCTALPDFLAPFRSMLGIKGASSPNNLYTKPLNSPKDPFTTASHPNKDLDPFHSNFGFGSSPSGHHGGPSSSSSSSGDHQLVSSSPYSSGGGGGRPSYSNSRPSSFGSNRPVRQQSSNGGGYRQSFPSSTGGGGRPSHFGGGPSSHHPSSSGGNEIPHYPRPEGPPSHMGGPGHDSSSPYKYQDGPSSSSPYSDGPSSSPFSQHGGPPPRGRPPPRGGPPPFPQGPPSNSPYQGQGRPSSGGYDGPPSNSPYQGQGRPSSGGYDGPPSNSPYQGQGRPSSGGYDGPPSDGEEGPGFSGFGSFPSGGPDEEDSPRGPPSRGPPPRGSPPGGSSPGFGGPSQSHGGEGGYSSGPSQNFKSRPVFESQGSPHRPHQSQGPKQGQYVNEDEPPSSSFFEGPLSSGGEGEGQDGPSDYPERYEGSPRDERQPQIITADDVNKYPPQINDDEEQGPRGGGYGFGGGNFGSPSSSSLSPQESNSALWGQALGGMDDTPSQSTPNTPPYQLKRRNHYLSSSSSPGKSFSSFPSPVQGSSPYQASTNNPHYSKPIMMTSSSETTQSHQQMPTKRRRHRKRYSAKFVAPLDSELQPMDPSPSLTSTTPKIIPLTSPQDPNYQASSLNPVSAPFEPDTAASGHGHGGGDGGYEGLSPNGDRILYHVSGHHGPDSYRFGYDTGKGYNRLFRFEEKDGKGYVKGKYGFYDKHGKMQVINYEAHPKHGFHAERANSHKY